MTDSSAQTPAPLDPAKYHVISSSQKRKWFILAVVVLLILGPFLAYAYYGFAVNRPAQSDYAGEYVIEEGTTVSALANDLHARGLINSEFLFKLYIKANSLENSIQAGVFQIPAGSSTQELVAIFQKGKDDAAVTFIEGWRVEEMALAAVKAFPNVDYRNFVEYGKQYEGYLFPDTYSFNSSVDEEEIIDAMRAHFDDQTAQLLTEEKLKQQGLTKEQALIFASILEREINTKADMPIVAGILIKRFKDGELIGADATTQYMMANEDACSYAAPLESSPSYCLLDDERAMQVDWWPKNITLDDLETPNPYNTRKVVGLPPTPISNPGLAAIKAVVEAVPSDYYFYLSDAEGVTRFAKDLTEHEQNISTYLQ